VMFSEDTCMLMKQDHLFRRPGKTRGVIYKRRIR
jgi:hypothetical protein